MSAGSLIIAEELHRLDFGHMTCITLQTSKSQLYRESLVREKLEARVTVREVRKFLYGEEGGLHAEALLLDTLFSSSNVELVVVDESQSESFPFDCSLVIPMIFETLSSSAQLWVFSNGIDLSEGSCLGLSESVEEQASPSTGVVRVFKRKRLY